MPYKVGTLCYIKGDHDCVGMICKIIAPLMERPVEVKTGVRLLWCYIIEVPNTPPPHPYSSWAAQHNQLIPIFPSDCDIDQKTDVPAHA